MIEKKDDLETYLKYLDNKSKDNEYVPTSEENTAIYNISNDVQYINLYNQIKGIDDYDSKRKIVSAYKTEQELKKAKNPKDLISKIYGINVEDIESLKLNNGKEVFTFYDTKQGRKRIIENLGQESLVSKLKEIQNNNIEFQGKDYKKNSNDILANEAEKNNNRQEFKMVEIDDYINHPENYGTLDNDTRTIIEKLSEAKETLQIRYINIENKVGLTKDNRVIEIAKNQDGVFVFVEPTKWKNNVDEMSNEDKVNENNQYSEDTLEQGEEENNEIEENDFEDEPEFVSSEEIQSEINAQNLVFEESPEEIRDKIKEYYEDPSKMNNIDSENKKSFYEKMVNEVYAVRKAEYEKKKEQKRSMIYKNPDLNSNGFVNLIFVSILLLFLAFILFLGF